MGLIYFIGVCLPLKGRKGRKPNTEFHVQCVINTVNSVHLTTNISVALPLISVSLRFCARNGWTMGN